MSKRIFTVVDPDARIRGGPPNFRWRRPKRVPQYTRVHIEQEEGKYVRVVGVNGKKYGWTVRSNLSSFFKDSGVLVKAALAPERTTAIASAWPPKKRALARTYNRLGGLLARVARSVRVEAEACLAVWQVESGGKAHRTDQAIIRFENHLLFRRWGDEHLTTYNRHFRHGGHNGIGGKAWKNHRFRERVNGAFEKVHASQASEYRVLQLAQRLSNASTAVQSISIGGPQILVSNHRPLGYRSATAMYEAFQASERAHVLGFFDFCAQATSAGGLFDALRRRQWAEFAAGYNGSGQVATYSNLIAEAFELTEGLVVSGE